MSMMLHCGASTATFTDLKEVVLPEDHPSFQDKMDHYETIPHHQLVGVIRALLGQLIHKDVIVGEEFALNNSKAYTGAKFFGLFKLDLDPREETPLDDTTESVKPVADPYTDIENADMATPDFIDDVNGEQFGEALPGPNYEPNDNVIEIITPDAISPTLVIRNSYDRSMSVAGGLGYNCFICDNLALSGEIMFARKHTRRAMGDIMHIFTKLISTMAAQYQFDQEFREAAKNFPVAHDRGFEILGRMAGTDLLPFTGGEQSQMAIAMKEWKNPTHEVFEDRSLWSLFNAVTAAQGKAKIQYRLETASNASKVFREILGDVWVSKAEEIASNYATASKIR